MIFRGYRKEQIIKLKEIPLSERPYERLELYGESSLSNSELLAIIIGSGTKDETSISLSQKILNLSNCEDRNLRFIQDIPLNDLKKIKGIGRVKAIRIKALGEIAKRMERPIENEIIINSGREVAQMFMPEMRYEKKEIVKLVILNTKNRVEKVVDLALGNADSAAIEPRDILSEVLKTGCSRIILLHNHPSGNPTPSKDDYNFTARLNLCAKMLGIELLEHIIIGDGIYESVDIHR